MTIERDKYHQELEISRNKVKMILNFHLNSIADAIILDKSLILPIPTRSGFLEYHKNREKFEIYLELMTEIYINLVKGQVRTKRDLFYGNTVLFKKQTILDSAIRTLAKALSVPRDALNVIGAGKGLYFGEIMIDDQKISSKNVNLIPRREDVMNLDLLDTRFILVIEKDAVMNVIVDNYNHIKTILGSFLIVCGKGFPCLRTKQFLNLIQQNYPKLPKYILVDNDPFGIDIALNYVSSTENEMDSCPSLEYFGVDHFDIDKYGNPSMTESLNPTDLRRLETVKTRAKSLKRFKELDEIKFMQNNRKKAEMECLYNPDSTAFCTKFLLDKLQGVLPSKMEEDLALKKRILVDERIIRKLSMKILSSNNEGILVDLEQLEFHFDKSLAILKSFERDWSQITSLSREIGIGKSYFSFFLTRFFVWVLLEQSTLNENLSIENCKTDLISAKKVLQNRLEYDQIAKEILSLQSRPELLKNIEDVNQEISQLLNQIDAIDNRTHERNSECSHLLESIQVLLESLNSDIKEFK